MIKLSKYSECHSGFSTFAVLFAAGVVIAAGAAGTFVMSQGESESKSKSSIATSSDFYNKETTSTPTPSLDRQSTSSESKSATSSVTQSETGTGTTSKPGQDNDTSGDTTQEAKSRSYVSKDFNFSFSYPDLYPAFSDQTPPDEVDQSKPNVRRYKRASNEPPLSDAIKLKENKITKQDGYPTLHLHVTDLEDYFYRYTSAGAAIEYNSAKENWYETSPVGENRKPKSLETTTVGGRTGYTFRSGDAGFVYDGVAVPYPEEDVMIELGFTISPSTEKSISQSKILQSFEFQTNQSQTEDPETTTSATDSPENSGNNSEDSVMENKEKEYLLVRGKVNLPNNKATFRSFTTARTTPQRAKAIGQDSGDYTLIAYNEQDQKISETNFEPSRAIADPGGPSDNASFTIPVEKQSEITKVAVQKDGKVIGEKTASDNPPSVEVVYPNGGENITGEVEIRWEGSDPDGDSLEYTVSYSNDGGDTYKALRTSWPRSSTEIDSLAGAENGLIKVQASDGFNTATDISDDSFQVPNKKPDVRISRPEEGQEFDGSRNNFFYLEGWVQDPEDGLLSGDNLVWKSSKDGILVTGEDVEVYANEMSVGDHIITLEATDSDGASSIATTSITITDE